MRALAIISVVVTLLASLAHAAYAQQFTQADADAAKQAMLDAKETCIGYATMASTDFASAANGVAAMNAAYAAWQQTHPYNPTLQGVVSGANQYFNAGNSFYTAADDQRDAGDFLEEKGDIHYSASNWRDATVCYSYGTNVFNGATDKYGIAISKYLDASALVTAAMALMQ